MFKRLVCSSSCLGLLLAAFTSGVQAQTYTITFDAGDPINGLAAGTVLGAQYAAATGATFTPNAFTGSTPTPPSELAWATNTDVTVVSSTGSDVGILGFPELVSGNLLRSEAGWRRENGDPSIRMTLVNPARTVSIDVAGLGAFLSTGRSRMIAFNAEGTQIASALASGSRMQRTLTVNASGIASVVFIAGDGDDWVGIDNIRFTLEPLNVPPIYTPVAPISQQQGSPPTVATLGMVSDLTDPPNSLAVALVAGGTASGVAATDLANTNGTVTASLAASCSAASGTLRLRVTDLGGSTDTDDLQVNVTSNTAPSLAYSAIHVGVGASSTQNPSAGLNDNGSVANVEILNAGTYAGTISVSNTGVLNLSNASPAGSHTVTVRATDNCGANTDAVVQVVVAQASTIKEISSNVNPARFAQDVSLSVQVAGVDPTGSVEFFNGVESLGSAALTASPSGGANLKLATLTLTTLPVGSLALSARYVGDINNAASSSQILAQSVIAADTQLTLSSPANPLSVGSSAFNVRVQAQAPGGGVPEGSVTLSAGAASCVATLTAGSGSCSLNLASAGFALVTGRYTPSNSNHNSSIGGLGIAVVPTPSSTDLRVRIGNDTRNIGAGALLRYDVVVENIGMQAAVGRLEVPLSADFASASYSCTTAGQASCGAVGTGSIDTEISVAPGAVVIYSVQVTAPMSPERTITQTARITTKAPTTDPDLSNNESSDVDSMGLLADGYEDAAIDE